MELAFSNKDIRKICEDEDEATSELGFAIGKNLQNRLADLIAATTVRDLLVGNPGEITDSSQSTYKIEIGDGFRIIFCPNHKNIPHIGEKIDWDKVTRIKILQIENDNE